MKRTIFSLLPLAALVSLAAFTAHDALKPGAYAFRVESDGRQAVGFIATADGGELFVPGAERAPAARVCARTPATVRASEQVRGVTFATDDGRGAVRVIQVDREGRAVGQSAWGRHLSLRRDGARFLPLAAAHRAAAVTAANPCR